MVQACGVAKKGTHTKDSGNLESLKVTECILGSTEILTKDNSRSVSSTEKALNASPMETCTKEVT